MNYNPQKGISLLLLFFLMTIILIMVLIISTILIKRVRIISSIGAHVSLLSAADTGIEYVLKFLKDNPQQTGKFNDTLTVGGVTVKVAASLEVGGSRTITALSSNSSDARALQVDRTVDSQQASFRYGAQVGAGGLQMSNSSRINGNVFSNGNVSGSGIANISGDLVVAGNSHSLSGMNIGGNALVDNSCLNSTIVGSLTYVAGGTNSCTAGSISTRVDPVSPEPMPLSDADINGFKTAAEAGGTMGSVILSGTQTMSLGPKKIVGDLLLSNSSVLTLTGTVYVTGNITIDNSAKIQLASSYGSFSGILIADGTIAPRNFSTFLGSGQPGSYILVISTNTSDSAIAVGNNATGAVFYTSAGGFTGSNNLNVQGVVAYKLILSNSAAITYTSGLANTLFVNGPSAGWKVNWKEIDVFSGSQQVKTDAL